MALRKALMNIIQKYKGPIPEHLQELVKDVSQLKEQSIHIVHNNPSLRQEAQYVDQAINQLEKTVGNLLRESEVLRQERSYVSSAPRLTKTMIGLLITVCAVEEYGERCLK
ncbi:hypothetical protein MKW94_001427 [Papaver nudicaule]|uniref:Uncharacterized protein n=1 Tax=Papaver nudicaule TaxID=74823 RepID=A0AA42B1U6_PAPNU|nr:hypothetical protein [Papaver nudicaule]